MREKLAMIKELLDAKVISPDVVLNDSELQSRYMDHLFDLMGEDSPQISQPVLAEGADPPRPECCICFEQYVIDFVPNRCKHRGICMHCLYVLQTDASMAEPDPQELDDDYKQAARCPLCREKFIWIEPLY